MSKEEYNYQNVQEDLKKRKFIGRYGGNNSAWYGLAAVRAGLDLTKFHGKRTEDEYILPSIQALLKRPDIQKNWENISTFDPNGIESSPPTMAATDACMEIPELVNTLIVDNKIVNEDKSININKCAIDYVWNLPKLSKKLNMDEDIMRKSLAIYTQNENLLDKNFNTYLPPLGGMTVYFFGDISKLGKQETEIAVRVHDSCCGSDVFGTDICTCRPYLVFAIQACVECAMRGGVGVVVYFQKEGRGLGEVTKYRVYTARKNQKCGDVSEKYFFQTESIAGIRDARFQDMMPEVLLWLGITRIDWLLSMSNEKYDAITGAGIKVMQRISLPDNFVPKSAHVEINAKVADGYHRDSINEVDVKKSLSSLSMIRVQCNRIYNMALENKARHFKVHKDKIPLVVNKVLNVTKKNYPNFDIPYHSRWRHFNEMDLNKMTNEWKCDHLESTRRKIDLATVSVLLDAGAGEHWQYLDSHGKIAGRSEGLAIASMDLFKDGLFSSDDAIPCRVNAKGIRNMSFKNFKKGFQVHENNPLLGLESRFAMIHRLADALSDNPKYFGDELFRPGNLLDYVLKRTHNNKVSIKVLWKAIIIGLEKVWPDQGNRGDIWSYTPLMEVGKQGSSQVPFHKLSQWLAYSILEPIEALGIEFQDMHLMTGLPEYRNGGLLVDLGVLELKDDSITEECKFDAGSELIVEWRALTVVLLDKVFEEMKKRPEIQNNCVNFSLAKMLQGGTWTAGRIIAKQMRLSGKPPINVRSNGTVF